MHFKIWLSILDKNKAKHTSILRITPLNSVLRKQSCQTHRSKMKRMQIPWGCPCPPSSHVFHCFWILLFLSMKILRKKKHLPQCVTSVTCSSSIVTEWRKRFLMQKSNCLGNTVSSTRGAAPHQLLPMKAGLDKREGRTKQPPCNESVKAGNRVKAHKIL